MLFTEQVHVLLYIAMVLDETGYWLNYCSVVSGVGRILDWGGGASTRRGGEAPRGVG